MRFVVTLVLTVVLSGCVTIVEPLGDEPFELVSSEWNGRWCPAEEFAPTAGDGMSLDPADCIIFTVVDAAGGILDMTFLDERTEQMRVHARSARGSGAIVSAETPAGYELVGRARRKGSLVIVWPARNRAFGGEVEAGRLPGRSTRFGVSLDRLDASQKELIEEEDWRFFDWDEPLILLRVTGPAELGARCHLP